MQTANLIADARFTDDKPTVVHAVKTDQLLIDGIYLKSGQGTGWRKHPDGDRAYLCMQGTGELVIETTSVGNELRIPMGPGAVALAPRGVFHELRGLEGGLVCSALSRFPVRMVEKG